jgi:hypothetical protein
LAACTVTSGITAGDAEGAIAGRSEGGNPFGPTAQAPCSLTIALATGAVLGAAGDAAAAAEVHGVRVGGDMLFVSLRPLEC